jgi:hypothetical protein
MKVSLMVGLPHDLTDSMTETFTVRFTSDALDSPEYIGPFYSEDDAQDYCDARNGSLSLSGIPSSVACYSVVD